MNEYKIYLIDESGEFAQLEIESVDFSTTFSISDLTDISKRKDSISKNLKILGTKTNNRILGNLFHLNRDVTIGAVNLNYNYKANKQISAIVYENNIVVLKGKFQVIYVDKDINNNLFYDCVITGNVVKFFNQISDINLADLNYPSSSHTYNLNTIQNSWTGSTSYIYPSIDFGVVNKWQNNYDFRNYRAGVYLKTYFDAIFKTFGYSYTSTFANSDIFKKLFIPYPEKIFNRITNGSIYNFTQSTSPSFNIPPNRGLRYKYKNIKLSNATTNNILDVANTVTDSDNIVWQSYKFNRIVTTDGKISMNVNITVLGNVDSVLDIGIFPVENGIINFGSPISQKRWNSFGGSTISEYIELNIPLKEYPEKFEFVIGGGMYTAEGSCTYAFSNITLNLGSGISNVENRINDVLTMADVLPQNVKVYQFLTDLLKLFNLYITSNPDNENDFIIEDYDRFYQKALYPKTSAIDWSDKISNSELKSGFNINIPTKFSYQFKEDSSDFQLNEYKTKYQDGYGNLKITNNDGYSAETKVEVSFSSTVIVRNNRDSKVMPNIYTGNVNEDKKEPFKSNLRLLYNNGIGTCDYYDTGIYTSSGTTTATYSTSGTTYNSSSHILKDSTGKDVFNLQFGIPYEVFMPVTQSIFTIPTLYSNFYQSQVSELIDPNFSTFECDVWLNENDIGELDFQIPIYLNTEKVGDGYFKLLEVNYKSSLELSKVKLQKIIL